MFFKVVSVFNIIPEPKAVLLVYCTKRIFGLPNIPALETAVGGQALLIEVVLPQPYLLHSSWMTLCLQCGFDLQSQGFGADHLLPGLQDEARLVVDADMSLSKPMSLAMEWSQVVWLVIGTEGRPLRRGFAGPQL